jgi:hypothetical protein
MPDFSLYALGGRAPFLLQISVVGETFRVNVELFNMSAFGNVNESFITKCVYIP